MTRNKGWYRFRLPAFRYRPTKRWTQAEIDYCERKAMWIMRTWAND